jgi:hypothetical protein
MWHCSASHFHLYFFKLWKPSGYFMYHQVSRSSNLHFALTFLCILFYSHNKMRLLFWQSKSVLFLWGQYALFRLSACLSVTKYQRLNLSKNSTNVVVRGSVTNFSSERLYNKNRYNHSNILLRNTDKFLAILFFHISSNLNIILHRKRPQKFTEWWYEFLDNMYTRSSA